MTPMSAISLKLAGKHLQFPTEENLRAYLLDCAAQYHIATGMPRSEIGGRLGCDGRQNSQRKLPCDMGQPVRPHPPSGALLPRRWQCYRPEVWIEKSALLGVIEGVCDEFRVPYFAIIGNNSQLLQHEAGVRFAAFLDQGLIPLVFHLADHDPNGFDMTRDVRERLALYARAPIKVHRLALNLDQVRQYNPPPNFAKESDSRYAAYVREFGTRECWELDALSPTVIADLIRNELESLVDADSWNAALRREQRNQRLLHDVAENWTLVAKAARRVKERK